MGFVLEDLTRLDGQRRAGRRTQSGAGAAGRHGDLVRGDRRVVVVEVRRVQVVVILAVAPDVLHVEPVEVMGRMQCHRVGGVQGDGGRDRVGEGADVAQRRVVGQAGWNTDHGARDRAPAEREVGVEHQLAGLGLGGVVVPRRRDAQQAARTAPVLVEAQDIGVEPQLVLVGLVLQLGVEIGVVPHVALGGAGQVAEVALGLVEVVGAQPIGQALDPWDGPADGAFDLRVAEVADDGADLAAEVFRRTLGNGVDQAAHGVAPVEGALWAQQDLDLVDQHVVPPDQEGRVGEEVVVVDGHRAIREIDVVVAGEAPDHGAVQLARVCQARREVGHVLDRGDAFERAFA
jgi:hypothetical protein